MKARDETSSLFWLHDTESASSTRSNTSTPSNPSKLSFSFSFDQEVINSRVYRNAFASRGKKDLSQRVSAKSLRGSAASLNLLASEQAGTSVREALSQVTSTEDVDARSSLGPISSQLESNEKDDDAETIRPSTPPPLYASLPTSGTRHMQLNQLDCWVSEAIKVGNLSRADQLLEQSQGPEFPPKWFPWSLRSAIDQQSVDAVILLLNYGVQIEATDGFARTPLFYACTTGSASIARFLLEKGANIEAKNFAGETPLHAACLVGHNSVIELLISRGAQVECRNLRRETPLHYASLIGDAVVAKTLCANGSLMEITNIRAETPIAYAITNAHAAVLAVMVDSMHFPFLSRLAMEAYFLLLVQNLVKAEQRMHYLTSSDPLLQREGRNVGQRLRDLVRCAVVLIGLNKELEPHLELHLRQSTLLELTLQPVRTIATGKLSSLQSSHHADKIGKNAWRIPPEKMSHWIEGLTDEELVDHLRVQRISRNGERRSSLPDLSASTTFGHAASDEINQPGDAIHVDTYVEVSVETPHTAQSPNGSWTIGTRARAKRFSLRPKNGQNRSISFLQRPASLVH